MRRWYKEHEHLFSMVMYIVWVVILVPMTIESETILGRIVNGFLTLAALTLAYESFQSHRLAVYFRKLEAKQRSEKS